MVLLLLSACMLSAAAAQDDEEGHVDSSGKAANGRPTRSPGGEGEGEGEGGREGGRERMVKWKLVLSMCMLVAREGNVFGWFGRRDRSCGKRASQTR